MTMGKRQLVLAALVVALGAAVYLNWVLSGNGTQLPATQALASGTDRQYGQTLMVNGSAVSGKTSVSSAAPGKSVSGASTGKNSAVKTSSSAGSSDEFFSQARLDREKTQDTAKEQISRILEDTKSNDTVKKEAVDKAAVLIQNMTKETDIENVIKAKGYPDCVVTLDNNQCSVIVKTKTSSSENDAVLIQDVVASQTGLTYDKIKIIERS